MEITVKTPYEAVLNELEALYKHLQSRFPDHGPFRDAWKTAREDVLEGHGWDDKTFYAEMDARRSARSR